MNYSETRRANCVGARAYGIGFDLIAWLLGWSVESMDRGIEKERCFIQTLWRNNRHKPWVR